ncbi:MAG: 50S ribosome-binding GTPase [Lachnospiraceae bacterium]|nr:50S ribosome-binding GTPase [Lachnospiraceae bacterium]MBP3567913.1 50S ribosome-binding GTPase [Lachnospiraceae bacterium]
MKRNIMLVGGTGYGKSSTINALCNTPVAAVAALEEPETKEIRKYETDNMVLWDTPGIGSSVEEDSKNIEALKSMLREKDEAGNLLIAQVVLVMDAGSRDMGTSFELLNDVIVPNLGDNRKDRILVALNRCDAVKPRNWNYEANEPDEVLKQFLEEKAESVKTRISESIGIDVEVIYYCAGETENDEQSPAYNLDKLVAKLMEVTTTESVVAERNITVQKKESFIKRMIRRLFGR